MRTANNVKFGEKLSHPSLLSYKLFGGNIIGGCVRLWLERANQRRALCDAALDSHLLEDIGVSYQSAMKESSKPFWRK